MQPLVIAHRGANRIAPENTLSAFRAAIRLGADGIETDVQLTREGEMVIHHNYTVDACSDGTGKISEMTLAELRSLDFGIRIGPQWRGERIATLDECLETVRDMRLVNIELKAPSDRSVPYVSRVVERIRAHGMTDRVVLSAFDHSLLAQSKALCPELKVGALTMPFGFTKSLPFLLLKQYFPADRPLAEARAEDMSSLPPDALGSAGENARETAAELARQIGSVFPGSDTARAAAALDSQEDLAQYVARLDFPLDYLHCHYSSVLAFPGLPGELKKAGIGCNPWAPDLPEEFRAMAKSGCTGIITNRPDLLLSFEGRMSGENKEQ